MEEYVNLLLTVCRSFIEVSAHSPLARAKCVSPSELKDIPCILVACEREYYHDVVGFPGEFLYAENLEEARLMVIGHKGFLPVEGADVPTAEPSVVRIPLMRGNEPIRKNYCAFWKKNHEEDSIKAFANILKSQFQ